MAEEKKLDILLERIYKEAVEKAKKESEEIIRLANEQSKNIIDEANRKAALIVEDANKKAAETSRNTMTDIKMAGEQAVSALKQKIKNIIASDVLSTPMKDAFVDSEFLKSIILEVVSKWDTADLSSDVSLYFSDSMKDKVNDAFMGSIKKSVPNINVNFDNKMSNGFKITSESNGYQLSFTDEDFVEFFGDFVRQKTEEILFEK